MPISLLEIPDLLVSSNSQLSVSSANATFVYAVRWMEGQKFDLAKSAVKVHRARLRKLGLDIALPFDGQIVSASKFR
ncbi:phage/plasmid replication domain-containing protein [Pseudomonas syringae]|uniref:phage/plasmid replication domain-containing protein n=1 Tax=Pseudomonas syringae TaxID=317 RepID=UPI000EFFF352